MQNEDEESSFLKEVRTTEAYIDEEFKNSVKVDILDEIKKFITQTVRNELETLKPINLEQSSKCKQSLDTEGTDFLDHLKNEIDFLRRQVENRDDIIYTLLHEKPPINQNIYKKDTQNDEFILPKNPIKPRISNTQNDKLTFNNRYEALFIEDKVIMITCIMTI